MIQAFANRIDLLVHNRSERRDLSSLWISPYRKRTLRTVGVMVLDFAAIFASFLLLTAVAGADGHAAPILTMTNGFAISVAASLVLLFAGVYRRSWRFVSFSDTISMVITSFVGLCTGWIATAVFSGQAGRGFGILFLLLLHFCVSIMAMQLMRACRRAARSYSRRQQVGAIVSANDNSLKTALLIGDPEWSLAVLEMLGANPASHVKIVGLLLPGDDRTISQLAKVPVLGGIENLNQVIAFLSERDRKPDMVILGEDSISVSIRDMTRINKFTKNHNIEILKLGDPASRLQLPGLDPDRLPIADLLGRSERTIERHIIQRQISGQCVLVTGAGGTIGSELVMQLAAFRPSKLVLLDHSEFHLYTIEMRLRESFPDLGIEVELCSIRDADEVRGVFARHLPSVVYHAAALKHVPMVESNPLGGIHTNIIGTRNIANAVTEFSARAMVQVSTDKAVNPVGMMGATKRVGELYCQSLDLCGVDDPGAPRFITVRFGNVLGSSGSIVPLFKRQLMEGRPLTVTHPDIERFFMSVGEAVQLILESSSRSLENGLARGNIFVLDMGDPVKIVDLARRMIQMHGLEPDVDVPIQFVGLRPGEKLYEELFDKCEQQVESQMPNLFEACSRAIPLPVIGQAIDDLARAVKSGLREEACRLTHALVELPGSNFTFHDFLQNESSWHGSGHGLQLVQDN
ncbi:polysaccharide biosynthesis protein [Sphingopyxis sp.]|uniref:polysaccharide biosynthesis protein n=1 Tax=Sphingopyxis sp. TaxID=1908224 RepID=UPI003D132A8A